MNYPSKSGLEIEDQENIFVLALFFPKFDVIIEKKKKIYESN